MEEGNKGNRGNNEEVEEVKRRQGERATGRPGDKEKILTSNIKPQTLNFLVRILSI